jgi:hypothetical protein
MKLILAFFMEYTKIAERLLSHKGQTGVSKPASVHGELSAIQLTDIGAGQLNVCVWWRGPIQCIHPIYSLLHTYKCIHTFL